MPLNHLFVCALLLSGLGLKAQNRTSIDSSFANPYYQQRLALFRKLPDRKQEIVFLGNSITEQGEWQELIPGKNVINRGIGGDNTFGVLARLDEVVSSKPQKIFLLIGINDIGRGLPASVILNNYQRIIEYVKTHSPKTKLYLQSVLPLNDEVLKFDYLKNKKDSILLLNKGIEALSHKFGVAFINLHAIFADEAGNLKKQYTLDGIHLTSLSYLEWVRYLKQFKNL